MRRLLMIFGVMFLIAAAHVAQFERMNVVPPGGTQQPAVVTGSLLDATKTRQREAVGAIIAQASEIQPNTQQAAPPAGQGPKRTRRSQDDSGEIHLGGTGLLDIDEAAGSKAPHPLATANPDDYVVVCEAGCRPNSDKIVYRVSKTAASQAAIAARRLELTSAQDVASLQETVCIAGCYDREPVGRPLTTGSIGEEAAADIREASLDTGRAVLQGELEAEVASILASALTQHVQDRDTGPRLGLIHAIAKPAVAAVPGIALAAPAHLVSIETRVHLARKRIAILRHASQRWAKAWRAAHALPHASFRTPSKLALATR